ncbi:MAG: ABC transporter permease [Actinobacteria bacterium]|nr:ABC transporter permease [Actinomycetota bacterium]
MERILTIFLIGISFGSILFLLSAGLSLTMGLMRIVNLAHGAIFMVGAYVGLAVTNITGHFTIGLLGGAVAAGLVGLIMEAGFLRRLYKQESGQVLLTIGFIYIIMNVVQWIWGAKPLSGIVPGSLSAVIGIGDFYFPVFRFFMIGFGLLMAVLLWLFQDKTKVGATIRAGMDNRQVATALGINLKRLFTAVFALGSFVAGLCGLLGAPLMGINLQVGWDALLLAMIVVIVGGTGSVQGTLLGAMIIGLVDAFGKAYFPDIAYFAIYVALILILLFRPSGLLGRPFSIQKTAEEMTQSVTLSAKMPLSIPAATGLRKPGARQRLYRLAPFIGAACVLIMLGPLLPSFYLGMLTKVLIYAIFAISLDLMMGYGGLTSMGHAAFLGVAGYTVGILAVKEGIGLFWVLLPAGIVVAALISAIIGYICLRVSGTYFLLVTIAFGQLLAIVATKWYKVTGGTDGLVGIKRPDLGIPGFNLGPIGFYFLVFIALVVCFAVLYRIVTSAYGRALVGVRENEPRMRSLGYNTWRLKYVAIIISGTVAGVAGVFLAYYYGAMVPSTLAIEMSTAGMLMVILGGPGTLFGPFIGAIVVVLGENISLTYVPDRWPLILGGIFILCVMLLRGGFAPYLSRLYQRFRPEPARITDLGGVPDLGEVPDLRES